MAKARRRERLRRAHVEGLDGFGASLSKEDDAGHDSSVAISAKAAKHEPRRADLGAPLTDVVRSLRKHGDPRSCA